MLRRTKTGELGLDMELSTGPRVLSAATSAALMSGLIAGGIGRVCSSRSLFSGSVDLRFCSIMKRLNMAPENATQALNHHGNPSMPCERPAASSSPDRLGPMALAKLAEDCAKPLNVPKARFGVALASIMLFAGNEKACAVTFQTRIA